MIAKKDYCSGCGACMSVCPVQCIEMASNEEGFYVAAENESLCINCNRCKEVCPMINICGNQVQSAYSMVSKVGEIYNRSASGGAFSHMAGEILERGGSVWGCGYDENMRPTHIEARNYGELDNLRRSKYVQSYVGDCFARIKKELTEKEQEVLFAGTPCQVAGLKNFLGREYPNLYSIDLVCHGVPSPLFFAQCIAYNSKQKPVKRYEFRLKNEKYKSYNVTYLFEDGREESEPYYKDAFFNEFYDTTSLNECCYQCPYASEKRPGDVTIGDFEWGKKHHPELQEFSDVSCVLVNTDKGAEMLKRLRKQDCICVPTKLEWIEEKNLNLLRPTPRPEYRDRIYKELTRYGYSEWVKCYYKSWRYIKKSPLLRPAIKAKILLNKIIRQVRNRPHGK